MTNQTSLNAEEKLTSLFQPDSLAPAQYLETFRRKAHLEPEKELMLAVLEDGIACFQNHISTRDKGGKGIFREAEEWIMEENSDWLFSFENICEVFGLNPQYMRQGLIHWKERRPAEHPKAKVYHLTSREERRKPSVVASGQAGQSPLRAAAR